MLGIRLAYRNEGTVSKAINTEWASWAACAAAADAADAARAAQAKWIRENIKLSDLHIN